jgi:hypothetical protein
MPSQQRERNKVMGIDLRISNRMDQPVHSPFSYVLNKSILQNLQYALVWDSLRPSHDNSESSSAECHKQNEETAF